VRERLVSQRTGIINQIRAFLLERGIAVRQGLRFLRVELPGVLATRSDVLSPRMLRVVEDLAGDWRRLDARIEGLSGEIEALARQDQACVRLMTVPGIGPIISSAMVAAIGSGDVFSKGRDFGAWLGLVPKQISTGDRTILGRGSLLHRQAAQGSDACPVYPSCRHDGAPPWSGAKCKQRTSGPARTVIAQWTSLQTAPARVPKQLPAPKAGSFLGSLIDVLRTRRRASRQVPSR